MGATTDLRNFLKDDTARVRFGLFKKIVTSHGLTIEVGQEATNQEVAAALKAAGMTDPLPTVEIAPAAPIQKNITGASELGQEYKSLVAGVRAKVTAARSQLGAAVSDLDATSDRAVEMAKALQAEADDLKASLGQTSNMGPT
jgi:hypothetical protein